MPIKETPTEAVYAVLQDHGPGDGGWGIAALSLPGVWMGPLVYGGSIEKTIQELRETTEMLARVSGKPTLLAKFTQRENVLLIEGEGERFEI